MELPADESAQAGQLGAAQAGQPSAPQAGQLNAAHHHAQPHLQTLDEAVNKFLNNAKAHFGEASTQVNRIRSFLGLILNGDMYKREAFSSTQATIKGQAGLSNDLADILNHRDARWTGGDTDFDPNPSHSWPDFMQPSHEPQMRSLSMPASTPTTQPSNTIGDLPFPEAFNEQFETSYGNNLRSSYTPITHNNWASWPAVESSSPMLQGPSNFGYSGQSVPPSITMMTNQWGMSAQNTGDLSMRNSWSSYDSNQSFQQPFEPSNPYIVRASQSPMASPGMITTPSVLGIPLAVPIGQPRGHMPPPKNSIRRPIAPRDQPGELEGSNLDQPQLSASLPKKVVRSKVADTVSRQEIEDNTAVCEPQQNERQFIHAICGKSFGTRYRVKKHHWGVNTDDLNTMTGCWARHNKPDVSWDEHPSCREAPATCTVKKFAAKVVQKKKEGEDQTSQSMGSYHSHRLPSQDSFDTLLSAVNMVAHIDMPKPHDQNESAASHLESQVLAMEDQMPQTSASFDSQGGKEPDESEHGSHRLDANGSQIYAPEHGRMDKSGSAPIPPKTTATNDHIKFNPLKRGSTLFESGFLDSSERDGKVRKISKQ